MGKCSVYLTSCALCGSPLDLRDPHLILPLARVHDYCQQGDGRSPDELSALYPCCQAKHLVMNMGGCIVEHSRDIPKDELWISIPQHNDIQRFRIRDAQGRMVMVPVRAPLSTDLSSLIINKEVTPNAQGT